MKITRTIYVTGIYSDWEINTFKDNGYCLNIWRINGISGKKEWRNSRYGIKDKAEFLRVVDDNIHALQGD